MLIRNIQFFEQVDSADDIQGGVFAGTAVGTSAAPGFGDAGAAALGLGDFRAFTKTDTTATAGPFTGSGAAGAAASGADRDGSVAGSVVGSVSVGFG